MKSQSEWSPQRQYHVVVAINQRCILNIATRWLLVVAFIHCALLIKPSTIITAFHIHDMTNRIPVRRIIQHHRGDSSSSSLATVVQQPVTIGRIMMIPTRTVLSHQQSDQQFSLCSTTTLGMVKNRVGLEQRRESATPLEGGMTLYVKAGPDGTSLGDCPFAHFIRIVLEVKGLEYELKPSVQDTKPGWLIEHYDGKMPALRHRKECYVESDTIAAYLEFFFPKPELTPTSDVEADIATAAVEGLLPAMSQFIKHTPDGDEEDMEKKDNLRSVLTKLNDHLSSPSRTGPYLVGNGNIIRMNDCKLAPLLYHMCTAIPAYKGEDLLTAMMNEFPFIQSYTNHMFHNDPSFQKTVYPPEVVVWGWGNARNN